MPRALRAAALLLPLVLTTPGCRGNHDASAAAEGVGDTIGTARRQAVIAREKVPYRTVTFAGAGTVTGVVRFDGTPRGDTTIIVPADQNGCGRPLTIRRLERHNGLVTGALVWLTDVRAGVPVPAMRRFELDNSDCSWDPVVQAVVTGGTLDVQNSDPLVERTSATDIATGDTVAVAPFTDPGEVVPFDRLLRTPGLYEWSAESRPMSRAWVAVFDHPYFAVTTANGAFTIGGVPPGTHHIRAWHPMLGVADGIVTVPASGAGTIALQFR